MLNRRSVVSGLAALSAAPVVSQASAPETFYDRLLQDPSEILESPPGSATFEPLPPPDHLVAGAARQFVQYLWDMSNGKNVEDWILQYGGDRELEEYRAEIARWGRGDSFIRQTLSGFLYDYDRDQRVHLVMSHMRKLPDPSSLAYREVWGTVSDGEDDGLFSICEVGSVVLCSPEDAGRIAIWIDGVAIN
jgi:hypothetical protein